MSFNERYLKFYELVKPYILEVSAEVIDEISLSEPLNSSLKKFLKLPSKHIRALSAFLYLKASNMEITDKQISLQSAIELIHNASLLHDDVIDNSIERRGCLSLNSTFGSKLSVISGDYLLAVALKKIRQLESFQLVDLFSEMLSEMCKGEVSQHFSVFKIPSLDDYIEKSRRKTATLFQAAIEGAAIVSGGLSRQAACDFAINLGIAFQIRDDLINIKTTKSDLAVGVYTAPVIFANSIEDCESGIEKTSELLDNYIVRSVKALDGVEDNQWKRSLIGLLELLKYE